MSTQQALVQRRTRMDVDIPVTLTTVLDSTDAAIADLNEEGALIKGYALDVGARVQIEYPGQTVYAQCRWTETDRMGVAFVHPLTDGPLFARLQAARADRMPGEAQADRMTPRLNHPARRHGGFGRRAG